MARSKVINFRSTDYALLDSEQKVSFALCNINGQNIVRTSTPIRLRYDHLFEGVGERLLKFETSGTSLFFCVTQSDANLLTN